jgi:hypothetical protein
MAMADALAHMGEDIEELMATITAYYEALIAGGETAAARDLEGLQGSTAVPAGRLQEGIGLLMRSAEHDPFNATSTYGLAALAALLDHDRAAASAALAGLESTGVHGRIVKLDKQRTQAGIDALDGRGAQALAGFRVVLDEYRRLELPFCVAQTGIVMCAVLEPSLPEVEAAEREARSILEALGAQAWLHRLDDALSLTPERTAAG